MFSKKALKHRQRQRQIKRSHTRKFRHQTHNSLVHFHYTAPSIIQFISPSSDSIRHSLPASHILLCSHGRMYFVSIHNAILWTCWRILLIFYNFLCFLGVFTFLYSFSYFASVHTRIHLLLISHRSNCYPVSAPSARHH